MSITLDCPCGKRLQIGTEHAGKPGMCPECLHLLDVPADNPSANGVEVSLECDALLLLAAPVEEEVPVISLAPLRLGDEVAVVTVSPLPVEALLAPKPEEATEPPPLNFVEPPVKTPPRYQVFSPTAVVLATLLGGILAGCIVLASNYRVLRRAGASRWTGAFGILAALGFLVFLFVFPEPDELVPVRRALYVLLAPLWVAGSVQFGPLEKACLLLPPLLLLGVALSLQQGPYAEHLRAGGKKASTLSAVGISLFCTVLIFTGLAVQHAVCRPGHAVRGELLTVGSYPNTVRLHYPATMPRRHAVKVAQLLHDQGPLDGTGTMTVHVWEAGEGYVLSFVVAEEFWEDPQLIARLRLWRRKVRDEALDGRPVSVEFCDPELTKKRKVR